MPTELTIGDQVSQEEIEEAFDTGFGYQISGINPRRDKNDNRYILLFTNESGPYDDTVTQGEFKYIGEGLEGDQSESSPGNAALIDACTADIPTHFFYKRTDESDWEYQGLVDVVDYERQQRNGRSVLVFTLEHREETPASEESSMSPSDETDWLTAVRTELERYQAKHNETIITLSEFYAFAESKLAKQFPTNNNVRAKIRQQLQLLRDQNDIEFLDEQGTYRITLEYNLAREKSELKTALTEDPVLTEDDVEYTEQRRRLRGTAFTELVREAYEYQCAICGAYRESPGGQPEVEAAHIYPKSKDGRDDLRNGIALCKLHHWAFDVGWLSLSDNYEILVADAPDSTGYHEFKQHEGDQITVPNDESAQPHRIYLHEHRRLHGFAEE